MTATRSSWNVNVTPATPNKPNYSVPCWSVRGLFSIHFNVSKVVHPFCQTAKKRKPKKETSAANLNSTQVAAAERCVFTLMRYLCRGEAGSSIDAQSQACRKCESGPVRRGNSVAFHTTKTFSTSTTSNSQD